MNHWEYKGRLAKVEKLCAYLNRMFAGMGLDMTNPRDRYKAAEVVRGMTDKEWLQLSINIGKTKATVPTRLAVINEYTKTVAETGWIINEVM